ncbi:serine hydrolase domain-containing protein [Streptomyces sp. NBC_01803]|uniref:serine hydrolase domain-containing protein n=1 Tax=Streptomyces sp. NBC_01803 TaxID=2975946 RepID=UPI002DDAA8C4|nr:serine hydrolase domain-containing protein [Streptomyces sp. NBC_01803]WSA44913.1 beta-lactamase family protein [Streptomyces sp. NBC_01803]
MSPVLRDGAPREAGLSAEGVARLVPAAEAFMAGPEPSYPGFVLLAARHGVVVARAARGWAVCHGGGEPVPMAPDTVFDIASLSKLFTATAAVCLAERGALGLDAPLWRGVTARALLTHTSGLPAEIDLGPYPDNAARLAAIAAQPLTPGRRVYSDLGFIVLGDALERVAGQPLDELVAELITGPLGMADTGYRPDPAARHRIAATEDQPWTGRGMVRGTVHDENAHHLGGVAGHAGLFSTARDLAVLTQTMLDGGRYGPVRVLAETWTRTMLGEGLGWQLDQPGWMGELASPTAFGHTGFTGTSLVADPATGALLVLLTNRVHPTRARGTDSAYRRAVARELARALGR